MKISPDFRRKVFARERMAGTFLNLGSPLAVEMAGCAGFDWVLIDQEHGIGGEDALPGLLMAAATTPAFPVVRIAANEPARFKRALDFGAGGIMVPWVNTAEQANQAVAAMRYPPRGVRGVTKLSRSCEFGSDFGGYFTQAHERLVCMLQIETGEAVENVEQIAAVDGADVLFIGPMDLSTSLGVQEQFDHPKFKDALRRIGAAAKAHNKAAGILLLNPAMLPLCNEHGITVIALGSDGGHVNAGMRASATAIRNLARIG
jgi:2-keto-3-deoxy-L-rhamnonate aldolase RhmA